MRAVFRKGELRTGPPVLRWAFFCAWAALGIVSRAGAAGQGHDDVAHGDEALKVRVEANRGPFYVGQAFKVQVGVVGERDRPKVEEPKIEGADVWKIDERVRPIAASGIGGVAAEQNLFLTRYRVVARRPGALKFPAIEARLRHRTGRGRSFRMEVRPVPLAGRAAAFLGGVGEFEVAAEAEPRAVRVGGPFEYRLTVRGPAAWGTTSAPDLKRFEQLAIGLQTVGRSSDLVLDPPARRFTYRFRPTRPGEAVLPPVSIAAFDPKTMRYVTRAAPGVLVRAVAAPALRPSDVDLSGAMAQSREAGPPRALPWFAGFVLFAAALGLVWVRLRTRGRRRGSAAARKLARRTARRFGPEGVRTSRRPESNGPAAIARAIQSGLVDYLEAGVERPPGALTPDEAFEGTAACTGSEELARRAAQISARCDEILYRQPIPALGPGPGPLLDEARALFTALGRARRPRARAR